MYDAHLGQRPALLGVLLLSLCKVSALQRVRQTDFRHSLKINRKVLYTDRVTSDGPRNSTNSCYTRTLPSTHPKQPKPAWQNQVFAPFEMADYNGIRYSKCSRYGQARTAHR